MNNNKNNLGKDQLYNQKQFSPFAVSIFKFYTGLFDKYGVLAINWAGTLLGLNKNGRPVSQQTTHELAESMLELAEKLKNPEVMAAFIKLIQEMEPILQEVIISMLNIIIGTGEYFAKDLITFVCYETPAAPICGLFKFAANTIDLGLDVLDGVKTSVETITNTEKVGNNFANNLSKLNSDDNNNNNNNNNNNTISNNNNNYNNNNTISNNNNDNNNSINNTLNNASLKAKQNWDKTKNYLNSSKVQNQLQGAKNSMNQASLKAQQNWAKTKNSFNNNINSNQVGGYKKLNNEKKIIESRINHSLKEFFNFKKKKNNKRTRRK